MDGQKMKKIKTVSNMAEIWAFKVAQYLIGGQVYFSGCRLTVRVSLLNTSVSLNSTPVSLN